MRVLVTGGAGYIGSVTAAALVDAGCEVTVLDNLRSGHRALVPTGARFVHGDVADPADLAQALARPVDACMHFAARIEAGESMRRPESFFAHNTGATLGLLEALVAAGVQRFVLSSTAAVYGEPVKVPIDEDDPTRPTNAYGASKLLIEEALAWMTRLGRIRSAALRYFNAAGATAERGECHDPETHLVPLVLDVASGRRAHVDVLGTDYPTPDGTCVRDYVHVADLADAHVRALGALDTHDRISCNLGNGSGFSVREVVDAARAATGHPIPTVDRPRRPGDPATLVASAQRAHDLLGWWPVSSDLEQIVGSAWEWHQRRDAVLAAVN